MPLQTLPDLSLQPSGHIISLSKFVHMFLNLPGSHLEAELIGGRVNRGGGYGLEAPCNYCLTGQKKAIELVKKKITVITKDHRTVVQMCLGR